MVQIAHDGTNEDKINEILNAAQKRFGLYGYGKTTMQEIAEDIGLSKATLYYYYPDKENLFRAVFDKEQHEFIEQLHTTIDHEDDPNILLKAFNELRLKNFQSFFNLARASMEEFAGIKNLVRDLWIGFRKQEVEEISRILAKGKEQGLFEPEDVTELAQIYLDIIAGLSHLYLTHKDITYINEENFRLISERIDRVSTIFLKGISTTK